MRTSACSRRWCLSALVLLLVVVLPACGSAGGSQEAADGAGGGATADGADAPAESAAPDSGEPAESAESAESAATAGAAEDADPLPLALVLHLRIPFTEQIADGAEAAAEDLNVDLQTVGPPGFDPPAAVQAFQDVITAGAQGVATVPFPGDLWAGPIATAQEGGVPVLSLNVAAPESDSPVFVGEDSYALGSLLADQVVSELGGDASGSIVVGICSPGALPLELRMQGIFETFAEDAPGVEVLGPFDVSGDPSTNFSTWESLIQANPDALAYVGICAQDLPNLVEIKERAADADYVIAGVDLEPDALRGIADGTALATIGQSPFMQGFVPIRLLAEHLRGEYELPEGWIDSGLEVVTAENVAEVTERENSPELTREFYQDRIEEIFADPAAATEPLESILDH